MKVQSTKDTKNQFLNVLVYGEPGQGKCLGKGTPLIMADGSVKKVEDVLVGDMLMGPDSKPRKVLSLARGREKMYKVIPNYGDEWTCNESHILSLRCNYSASDQRKYLKNNIYNMSVREFLDLPPGHKHNLKLWKTGIDFEEMDVPYDPYWVGLWLGDGSKNLTTISKPDVELECYFEAFADKHNLTYRKRSNSGERCPSHLFATGAGNTNNPLLDFVKTLLKEDQKHIPDVYKYNSFENRMFLLAGLLDTDGYMCPRLESFEFCTKYEHLKNDFLYLARSLGFKANSSEKIIDNRIYYRIYLSGRTEKIPTLIPRKQASKGAQKYYSLNTGFELEDLGEGDYYGFEIDGDGLFLLGDFTVTHNTSFGGTAPNPLFLSAESGLLSLNRIGTFDYIDIKGFGQLRGIYDDIVMNECKYETIVIDSLTEVQTLCSKEILAERNKEIPDGYEFWNILDARMTNLVKAFRDLPKNVIFTCLAKADETDGGFASIQRPFVDGKLRKTLAALFDEVFYAFSQDRTKDGKTETIYALRTKGNEKFIAKDRSGKLNDIEKPNFTDIYNKIYGGEQ